MKSVAVLAIHEFDQPDTSGFYIRMLSEHLEKYHHSISVPHKHNFYLTVLFTQGSGFHEVDFERFEVKRGSIFFLNPGQTHYWELSADIEGYIFFHSESFYNLSFSQNTLSGYPFFYSTQNSPHMLLEEGTTASTASRMTDLLQEYRSDNPWKNRKINNLVDGIYIDLSRIYISAGKHEIRRVNKYSEKLKQLETLIDKHFKEEKSPARYAAMMNMSPKHLNRIVQHAIGKTTTQLITERILLEAKRLLSHSELGIPTASPGLNLIEIAELLGYAEYPYFSRLFRKHTGQTPSEFKSTYNTG